MSDLRTAAQQALETLQNVITAHGYEGGAPVRARDALRAALAQPCPPPEAQTEVEKLAYAAGWWAALERAHGIGGGGGGVA